MLSGGAFGASSFLSWRRVHRRLRERCEMQVLRLRPSGFAQDDTSKEALSLLKTLQEIRLGISIFWWKTGCGVGT